MLRLSFITLLAWITLSGCGNDQAAKVSDKFMPNNQLWMEDGFVDNGMTEALFNQIIDNVASYYKPIVAELGGNLVIIKKWKDPTVNAYADRNDGNWNVTMFGGMSRRDEVTPDGFAMVLAHEIGHHLGGFPASGWASNEGQSDYFALHAAAKLVWANEDNSDVTPNPDGKELCDKYLKDTQDPQLCYRQMNAGYSLAQVLAALGGTSISFKTPDPTIVGATDNAHPEAQCRLDTYVAGTLCSVQWNNYAIPRSEAESAKYLCTGSKKADTYPIQARPRCWFKPKL